MKISVTVLNWGLFQKHILEIPVFSLGRSVPKIEKEKYTVSWNILCPKLYTEMV